MGHQDFTMRRFTSTKTTAMGNRRGVQNPRGATLQPQPCPCPLTQPLLSSPGSPGPFLPLRSLSHQCPSSLEATDSWPGSRIPFISPGLRWVDVKGLFKLTSSSVFMRIKSLRSFLYIIFLSHYVLLSPPS